MILKNSECKWGSFAFNDTRFSWFWIFVRIYVGWQWLEAGLSKFGTDAWTGAQAGSGVSGFLMGSLNKISGPHPDVTMWYAWFINHIAMPNAAFLSYLVTYGEIAVGIALIIGLFTGVAAFFGAFMNANFMFAGSVSSNPVLLILSVFIMCARAIAGYIGADGLMLHFKQKKSKAPVM